MNVYKGAFVDGKRHGFGVFEYANGARYEGEWFENLKVRIICYDSTERVNTARKMEETMSVYLNEIVL